MESSLPEAPPKDDPSVAEQKAPPPSEASNHPATGGGDCQQAATVRRSVKVEDLFTNALGEPLHSGFSSTMPQSSFEEVRIMYMQEYGKGLDLFLETDWYTGKSWDYLIQDVRTFEMFRAMLDTFTRTKASDYESFLKLPQIEARVTWTLVCMPRAVHSKAMAEGPSAVAADPELEKVLRRLSVFEHLVTNRYPRENLTPLSSHTPVTDPNPNGQAEFWHELGEMITLHDTSCPEPAWNCLRKMRQLLGQLENRDVLYSMAVIRCTGLGAEAYALLSDSVIVAKKFIEDEASSKGTNQVVQRLCGITVRSWSALR